MAGGRVLPVALLAGAWFAARTFVVPSAPKARQERTAMRGFKDDFYAWKETLSSEDQAMLLKQAQNEFDKKFRSTDDFKKSVSDEKINSFSKVLQKFFDNEREDHRKEVEMRTPDYGHLKEKATNAGYDWSLKKAIVEVDRDAERRWSMAADRAQVSLQQGDEYFADSAPLEEVFLVPNSGANHTNNMKVYDLLKEATKDDAKLSKKVSDFKVPADGEEFTVQMPRKLMEIVDAAFTDVKGQWEDYKSSHSESETEAFVKELEPKWMETLNEKVTKYYEARELIEEDIQGLKKFFRSQKNMPGKTKADVLKEIWKELPKHMDTPVAPLDDEMLTKLAQEPAIIESEFKHPWGTADKLYKSEAIDSFGVHYLLGVFETKAEAEKAFDAWNKEYEQAGADVQENLKNWAKQQEAELSSEQAQVDDITKQLEEARSR